MTTQRRHDLAAILLAALDVPYGLLVITSGTAPNRRSQAISALQAAKRELVPDHPEVLNLVIKPYPGSDGLIAIRHLPPTPE